MPKNPVPRKSVKKAAYAKPDSILFIEKYYGFKLRNSKFIRDREAEFDTIPMRSYITNENDVVTGLNLSHTSISDLSPIGQFIDLTYLNLTGNLIEDLSDISNLTKLESLFFGGNSVRDISIFTGLTSLKETAIWENPINDLTPLCGLINLRALYCQNTLGGSLEYLSKMSKLEDLSLTGNSICDL
jgi:Leucine-rich repeat (LRR) protein